MMPTAVDSGAKKFESRHGCAGSNPWCDFRFLDPALQQAHAFPVADLAVPAPAFRALALHGANAIVTENLRNFLALAPLPNSVAIFGSGDAAALLSGAPWLAESRILYWGDLDARGFAILSRLRTAYPKTESVMMDLATLELHHRFAVKVEPYQCQVPALTSKENAALAQVGSAGSLVGARARSVFRRREGV